MSEGAQRIAAERQRQVEAEGWTPEHDDGHARGELAYAAVCYALPTAEREDYYQRQWPSVKRGTLRWILWPWKEGWWKGDGVDRVRELEKAGALIAAEIDRLLRLDSPGV